MILIAVLALRVAAFAQDAGQGGAPGDPGAPSDPGDPASPTTDGSVAATLDTAETVGQHSIDGTSDGNTDTTVPFAKLITLRRAVIKNFHLYPVAMPFMTGPLSEDLASKLVEAPPPTSASTAQSLLSFVNTMLQVLQKLNRVNTKTYADLTAVANYLSMLSADPQTNDPVAIVDMIAATLAYDQVALEYAHELNLVTIPVSINNQTVNVSVANFQAFFSESLGWSFSSIPDTMYNTQQNGPQEPNAPHVNNETENIDLAVYVMTGKFPPNSQMTLARISEIFPPNQNYLFTPGATMLEAINPLCSISYQPFGNSEVANMSGAKEWSMTPGCTEAAMTYCARLQFAGAVSVNFTNAGQVQFTCVPPANVSAAPVQTHPEPQPKPQPQPPAPVIHPIPKPPSLLQRLIELKNRW